MPIVFLYAVLAVPQQFCLSAQQISAFVTTGRCFPVKHQTLYNLLDSKIIYGS